MFYVVLIMKTHKKNLLFSFTLRYEALLRVRNTFLIFWHVSTLTLCVVLTKEEKKRLLHLV